MSPVALWRGSADPDAPVVVLLHGRGATEQEIVGLADVLPNGCTYVAPRGPVALPSGGYAWLENQGIGRPVAASLRATLDWFWEWADAEIGAGRPVIVLGFSGGAAMAGALALDRPERVSALAVLYGTMPFDAGLDTGVDRLAGLEVFHAQATEDSVIPHDLLERTWRYLTADAGATAVTHRHPGDHAIDPSVVASLSRWLMRQQTAAKHAGDAA